MRVALFIQRYPPALGGSEAYFARLAHYLVQAGHQATVFTTSARDLETFWRWRIPCPPSSTSVEHGVQVRRYSLRRWPARRYILKALSLFPHRYWQCLTMPCNPIAPGMYRDAGSMEQRFDLVHATTFPYAFPMACGLKLARRQGIPFLITPFLHAGDADNPDDRTRKQYTSPPLRYLLHQADRVFVQTQVEGEVVAGLGVGKASLILAGLGVEPSECTGGSRQRARQAWQVGPDEAVVGHLANNSREKGTVDLLKAAEMLWQQGARFRVVLAGPQMPNFLRFWKTYPHKENVRCLGVLTDDQKRDFFAGIDMFALPSRSDSFGLVLLEAWANGVPNLAYRAGGIAEVIRHEKDGLLVPCGNISRLAESLQRLVDDREQRQALGQHGRRRTETEFNWEDKLQKVMSVYESLCPADGAVACAP